MKGQAAWDYFASHGPLVYEDENYRFDLSGSWHARPQDRVSRVEYTSRDLVTCGGCGGPAYAWRDDQGNRHIETHSDYRMGSDVPCDGSGW